MSRKDICQFCKKEFVNIKIHIKKSTSCKHLYNVNKDESEYEGVNESVLPNSSNELNLSNKLHQQTNKELCNGCRKHFKLIFSHLTRSKKCQNFYDMESLRSEMKEITKNKKQRKKT